MKKTIGRFSMPHSLILGMTESGKTTLAKQLAQTYKRNGIRVIVLDDLNSAGWQADFQTDDPELFLSTFWASRSCAVFIDESGDAVGRYNEAMQKTATRGRHWGHNVHFITQRGAQLAMTVRDQCSYLFLFTTSLKDCKTHSEEWNKPELLNAVNLPQGHFYKTSRYGECQRLRAF